MWRRCHSSCMHAMELVASLKVRGLQFHIEPSWSNIKGVSMNEKSSGKANPGVATKGKETARTASSTSQPVQSSKSSQDQVRPAQKVKKDTKTAPNEVSQEKKPARKQTTVKQNMEPAGKAHQETTEKKTSVVKDKNGSVSSKSPDVNEPRRTVSSSSEKIPRVKANRLTSTTVKETVVNQSPAAERTSVRKTAGNEYESSKPYVLKKKVPVPKARRMQLSLTQVEPWSVAKVSFLLSIAGALIQIFAAVLLWLLLNTIGLFDNITQMVSKTGLDAGGFDLGSVLSLGTVISTVTIFSIFEIIFVVALSTIGAFLYNTVCSLVGGIHVTLGDD